ncbi:MAG: hypothetical protein JWR64_583, partial [Marmoricola sp.]|nr:hypothetical protein [Marmoricola sp.]
MSSDLRNRVLDAKQSAGLTWSEIAQSLDLPKDW